jgi:2-deoxy-D-gluconate 3-dehydrogenase
MAPSNTALFSLEGRTALCTGVNSLKQVGAVLTTFAGATRGIGAQMAIALAEAGADILLVQVRKDQRSAPSKDWATPISVIRRHAHWHL